MFPQEEHHHQCSAARNINRYVLQNYAANTLSEKAKKREGEYLESATQDLPDRA